MALAARMRTGLYTSPHLCKFAERIRIGGAPITDAALETHLSAALALGPELSFFEAATLAALLALREARVDLAILEVGLGGRLDATNVVPSPAAAAITRIALDHTDLLGSTLEAIAFEKASIAKPGLDVIVGPTSPSVLEIIRKTCADAGATVTPIETDAASAQFVQNTRIGLAGAHQKDNARIAFALAKRVGIGDAACAAGISKVDWPGRMETLETPDGLVLLDAAHNPDGARALASELEHRDPSKTALVFGALADKNWPEMIDALAPRAAHRVYVTPKGRAAAKRHPEFLPAAVFEQPARGQHRQNTLERIADQGEATEFFPGQPGDIGGADVAAARGAHVNACRFPQNQAKGY
jgi:dihydrofolate synthase/folylpolyglutamate synthase